MFSLHSVSRAGARSALALFGLAALLAASSASADTISYQLDVGNAAIAGFPGPYADVLVDRTSTTTATITFTSNSVAGNTYLLGNGGSAGVNVNAATWTVSSLSSSNAGVGFTPGPLSDAGSGTLDGHGNFNQTLDSFDGYTHSADTVSFILTNTSGTWASAGDVLAPNASGNVVAAHIFVCSGAGSCDASESALATGFAVPEPSTALLLVGGLVALAVTRRR